MKLLDKLHIATIPDLHGNNSWEIIANRCEEFDKIIFHGDYVDSITISNRAIYDNLKEIIYFKKVYPEKVHLLVGNHDVQYMFFPLFQCDGFRAEAQPDLTILFNDNRELFEIAYQHKNYLWTHAGVSKDWFSQHERTIIKYGENNMLAGALNDIMRTRHNEILHQKSYLRQRHVTGHPYQFGNPGGITWADMKETTNAPISGYHQIVGHTKVDKINRVEIDSDTSVTYCDCLEVKAEALKEGADYKEVFLVEMF